MTSQHYKHTVCITFFKFLYPLLFVQSVDLYQSTIFQSCWEYSAVEPVVSLSIEANSLDQEQTAPTLFAIEAS